ncbi:MAG: PEGA domain-containing protein [Cystobacterineae bacterium]|nr:PEGA domain-containing protein [Cystobacterineae bacterium]
MRNLGKCLSAFIIFCAGLGATSSFASPKTLVMGTGNCSEETFLKDIQLLTTMAQQKGDITPIQLAPLFEKRKLLPLYSTQEEQRILGTVHSKILLGNYSAALRDIQKVLDTLEKSTPSSESWQLIAKALAMKGFALSKQKKNRASDEVFIEILKLDFNYELDHLIFPPTVIQSFERLRQALSKRRKASFKLSSSPEGAMAFVDGAPLGQTPLEPELLPGSYRIVLEKEGRTSALFVVNLSLEKPTTLNIPFKWEAAWLKPACLQEEGELAFSSLKQMARDLGAHQVLKLDMLPASSTQQGIRAALLDVNKDRAIREGGVYLEDEQREEPLEKLLSFMVSGELKKDENVVLPVDNQGGLIEPLELLKPPSSKTDSKETIEFGDTPLKLVEGQLGSPQISSPRGNTARVVSWIFIGAGGCLGVGGGVAGVQSLLAASDANKVLQRYGGNEMLAQNSHDGPLYRAFLDRKNQTQKIAIIMGAAGLASLTTGLILYFALPPQTENSPQLSIAPHFAKDGGGLLLVGRF